MPTEAPPPPAISTHALTEGDWIECNPFILFEHFNSRPHGGRHHLRQHLAACSHHFNSRPHGGRLKCNDFVGCIVYFNSRPHGGRHALFAHTSRNLSTFQLTPSRRATPAIRNHLHFTRISTHALTEGDPIHSITAPHVSAFQLTPSRRATSLILTSRPRNIFQLTPSRRATPRDGDTFVLVNISTHALTEGDKPELRFMELLVISTHALTEGDPFLSVSSSGRSNFNSRPHGGRRAVFPL